jgi:hypothetical protein
MTRMMMTFRDRVLWRIIYGALILLILLRLVHGSTGKRN